MTFLPIRISLQKLSVIILLINVILKSIFIQSIPPSQTYDEIIYASEAQSIVQYGTDLTGTWRPWYLAPSDSYYTELTSTLLTPGFLLFPNNPILASKVVPIVLGSLIPLFLALIAYRLSKSRRTFLFTALVATCNPWLFQFSRMGYDSLFSLSLYTAGMVILLYKKNWQKLWSLLPFFFGFYQYQGHKVLLVPITVLVLLYLLSEIISFEVIRTKNLKKFFHQFWQHDVIATVIVVVCASVLTGAYLLRLPHIKSSERISEFSIYDEAEIAREVDEQRRMSFDTPITNLFINKYTVVLELLNTRFINSFDLDRLFIDGDKSIDTFTVYDSGFFHNTDIYVLIAAILFFIRNKKDRRAAFFILGLLIIGSLPNVVRTGNPWITFRGSLAFLGIVLLMGVGGSHALEQVNKRYRLLLILLYALSTIPFLFLYFFRYPITHTLSSGFSERILASYVSRVGKEQSIYVVPDRNDATFDYLIAYNNLLKDSNAEEIYQAAKTRDFSLGNVSIFGSCTDTVRAANLDTTVFVQTFKQPCELDTTPQGKIEVKSLLDTGTIFTIYNDTLCSQFELTAYPHLRQNKLKVEELTDKEFCTTYFSQ